MVEDVRKSESDSQMLASGECETETHETTMLLQSNVTVLDHRVPRFEQIATSKIQDLEEFFKRPVSIYDATWAPGADFALSINPYELWAKNQNVRAKLRNFRYFRGNLKARILVTASPYNFGYLLSSWQPLAYNNDVYYKLSSVGNTGLIRAYLSQSPDKVYITVNDNGSAEISCPFIWYNNYYSFDPDTNTSTTIAAASNLLSEMGILDTVSIAPLGSTSAGSALEATVTVQAWCEDVELMPPTQCAMITAESNSEYSKDGPVSSTASAIARATRELKDVPMVGPLAMATSNLSDGVAELSSLFGLSRPPFIGDTRFMKQYSLANEASSNAPDTQFTLGMDVKRELNVDQSVVGDSTDPMSIETICNRESWIDNMSWTTAQASNTRINAYPCFFGFSRYMSNVGTNKIHVPTPMAFATSFFQYHRGTLVFRLKFIGSKFHRGKLFVAYEPNQKSVALTAKDIELNNQYGVIWDITEKQEIMVEVPYCSAVPFISNPGGYVSWGDVTQNSEGTQNWALDGGVSAKNTLIDDKLNFGWLSIRVLNKLIDGENIGATIAVFVSAKDVEVMKPRNFSRQYSRLIEAESAESECCDILGNKINDKNVFLYHGGECVKSLKSLLKRYSGMGVSKTVGAAITDHFFQQNVLLDHFPEYAHTYHDFSQPAALYYTESYFECMKYAFVGMRGGTRYKLFPYLDASQQGKLVNCKVTNLSNMTSSSHMPQLLDRVSIAITQDDLAFGFAAVGNTKAQFLGSLQTDSAGTVTYQGETVGVEFELPYYTPRVFDVAFSHNGASNAPTYQFTLKPEFENAGASVSFLCEKDGTNTDPWLGVEFLAYSFAVAEDFTFLRFQGSPFIVMTASNDVI